MLERVGAEYPPIPLIVCENGVAYPDVVGSDGEIDDRDRIRFLADHIDAMAVALRSGVNLRGYMVWSLLDNFDWARGYTKLFGLVRVDPATLERTVKQGGQWYRDFIATHRPLVKDAQ